MKCDECGLYWHGLCKDEKNCPARPSSCTVDSLVLAGFVGQAMWDEDGATWFDATNLMDTMDQAAEQIAMCVLTFEERKHRPECVRKGIRGTRIVHRRIVNTVCSQNATGQGRGPAAYPAPDCSVEGSR